ncbi:hypothetical protein [Microbacterium ulmi]|uniref:hypothetical protein n=1 Tax=Microbacterium ulmi TaxID=179095 RepID=UPI001FB9551F|nr:hypothetical protein [Microbacterium ulmi]NII68396.1 hypothetical protein [Microbacterium ulmi]
MTLELGPDDKRVRLRYAGTCRLCTRQISAGEEAVYERGSKTVRCIDCAVEVTGVDPGEAGAPRDANTSAAETIGNCGYVPTIRSSAG